MTDKQIDEVSGVETTGHEWDGIRNLTIQCHAGGCGPSTQRLSGLLPM